MYRSAVLALAALCACATDADPVGEDALEGAWRVTPVNVAHGCPDLSDLAPVSAGRAVFERDGSVWVVRQGSREDVYDAVAGGWAASATFPWDGCSIDVDAAWRFGAVGPTSFTATYDATFDLRGACEAPVDTCSVTWHVQGVR